MYQGDSWSHISVQHPTEALYLCHIAFGPILIPLKISPFPSVLKGKVQADVTYFPIHSHTLHPARLPELCF